MNRNQESKASPINRVLMVQLIVMMIHFKMGSLFMSNAQNAIEIVRYHYAQFHQLGFGCVLSVSSATFRGSRVGIQGSTQAVVKLLNVNFTHNKHVRFFCRVGQ